MPRLAPSPLLAALLLASSAGAGLPSAPVEAWRWTTQGRGMEHPWPTTVLAAPLQDRDGDGDADADDGPDLLVLSMEDGLTRWRMTLTAVDGRTGEQLWQTSEPGFGSGYYEDTNAPLAAADTDGDGFVEIFVSRAAVPGGDPAPPKLIALDHLGGFLWERTWPGSISYPGQALGLADLNQDGVVEATLVGNVMSVDGSLTWTVSETRAGGREYACFAQAVDLDPDSPGLELLYGANLWAADGTELWGDFFTPMGASGVGDLDGDGDGEVVVVRRSSLHLYDHRGVELQPPLTTPGSPPRGPRPSAPAVADFDGDGRDEVVLACNEFLVAYGHDGTALVEEWAVPVNDWSGLTGPSAFDFDADGAAEVVYRDQDHWFILEGADGAELHRQAFPCRTGTETPIVIGLPGECGALVVVSGFGDIETDDAEAWDAVVAYRVGGAATPRGIWNQRTYHGTNVTDDGRVPVVEPPPWLEGPGWAAQSGRPAEPGSLSLGAVFARDVDSCNPGIEVSWEPAVADDPLATIVYDVHRSQALPAPSCEDALAGPPVATGLESTLFLDEGAEPGRELLHVVRARIVGGASCAAPAESCGPPVVEEYPPPPEGVYTTLFLSHAGHEVTARWPAARALLPGESFRLLKTRDDPTRTFGAVPGLGAAAREHRELDESSPLQFFDLRVANGCERLSEDEYPPGR